MRPASMFGPGLLCATLVNAAVLVAQPCPHVVRSASAAFQLEHEGCSSAYRLSRDAQHCVFGTTVVGNPGSRQTVVHDVYCPGQMTMADANRLARALPHLPSSHIPLRAVNLLRRSYETLDLRPDVTGVTHLFHYRCRPYPHGRPGVRGLEAAEVLATHFKVASTAFDPPGVITPISMHATAAS
jgi:hypothetical protein